MTKIDDLIAAGNSMPPDTMKYRGLAKNVELSNWLAFGDELVTAAYIKDMGDGDFFVQAANAREDIKAMRDENKRLREALERISLIRRDSGAIATRDLVNESVRIAQVALGGQKDD